MPRVLWKGAITFGLVHVPINLYPGAVSGTLDLDLIDKRDFAPVGYRRINKRTGKDVSSADLVKGYQHRKGQYVVVTDEDFRQANVKATQTVEIEAFVEAARIAPFFFDTPYFLEPAKRGEKAYALLREALRATGRVGVARVVLKTRQHLAVVVPVENMLVLNTLRFADEIRRRDALDIPPDGQKKAGVSGKELQMATRLIEDMSEAWKPDKYKDTYRADLLARIKAKVKRGKSREITPPEEEAAPGEGAKVIDLMAALRKSLDSGGRRSGDRRAPQRAGAAKKHASDSETSAKRRQRA